MKKKTELRRDCVSSETIHIGIELELTVPGSGHDDDACYDSRVESQRECLEHESNETLLRDYVGLDRTNARALSNYFDSAAWIDDYMNDYSPDSCEGDCGHGSGIDRDDIACDLKRLTGNSSFKVVSDGSINHDDNETDAEVCWNYFISKETVSDNETIMKHLRSIDAEFNKSCGLHINLNNYLKLDVDRALSIPTDDLRKLFLFVAPSRAANSFCNHYGLSGSDKYSMIYNQADRFEFRFFSPTLEADKLNHYVTLAHCIYKRMAGKSSKLPMKSAKYFLEKIQKIHGVDQATAQEAIDFVNSLGSLAQLTAKTESQVA